MSKVAAGIFLVMLAWFLAGMQQFAHQIRLSSITNPAMNDLTQARRGIVVTTGSGGRIEAGARLMLAGLADRMLISGTGAGVSLEDIRKLAGQHSPDPARIDALFVCCVDIGPEALDTKGNAAETRNWAAARGLEEILLVTSDFHIPRALIEFRRAMPERRVRGYAVGTAGLGVDADGLTMWWRNPARIMTIGREYGKYLASLIG